MAPKCVRGVGVLLVARGRVAFGQNDVDALRATRQRMCMQLALQIVLIISSVLLVLLILLHRGRGGGLSSLFGGGVQSSLSGSSVVEKNLDRLTLFVGAIWLIAIIGTGL